MSPEQAKQILTSVDEVEAWAGGLLSKCAQLKGLIESTGAVSTVPPRQPSALSLEERADIAAKFRARICRRKPLN